MFNNQIATHKLMFYQKLLLLTFLLMLSIDSVWCDCQPLYNQKYIGRLLKKMPKTKKFVALTFDDGPSKLTTPSILNVLKMYQIKATFFMLGQQADKNSNLVEQVIYAGHEIGNHSYSHPVLTKQSNALVHYELNKTQQILLKFSENIHWFRPPYGLSNAKVREYASEMGLYTVLWSVDSKDWKHSSRENLKARVLKDVKSGSVILFHDTKLLTVKALPDIIETLKLEGYEFVTMTEWLIRVQKINTPVQLPQKSMIPTSAYIDKNGAA